MNIQPSTTESKQASSRGPELEGARWRATATRHGRRWAIEVQGVTGPAGFQADTLAEAERKAAQLVWGYTGVRAEVFLDVLLPGHTADRLWLIGEYRRDLEHELRAAFEEMTALRLRPPDIDWLFEAYLDPPAGDSQDHDQPLLRVVARGEQL